MAACIKIVLSGNPVARDVKQASLPSQTVVFRNSEPGRHPAFTDFMIQSNDRTIVPTKQNNYRNEE
jgi:hypothetical protein